jgi:hypothetical protein
MSDRTELIRQIGALVEELGRVAEEEREAGIVEAKERILDLTTELEQTRAQGEVAVAARQNLEHELEVAEKRIETLVQKLKEARQATAEAGEEAQRALRRQLDALQQECDDARADLETERSARKRLEKGAAADEKRLGELEKALAGKPVASAATDRDGKEAATLRAELEVAFTAITQERQARERVEADLEEAHDLIQALQGKLKQTPPVPEAAAGKAAAAEEVRTLTEKLRAAEERADHAQRESQQHAAACASAERRIAVLEETLKVQAAAKLQPLTESSMAGGKPSTDKALPHELRPPPKPGAIFRPNWDLERLPCKSADQILQAWESVSNVQLSLEGYPSQYCAAFLVVLKQGKLKQLYILFNLKMTKHVLVCIPSKLPTDEASLNKAISEGLKYLQMSGFELDKIKPEDFEHQLGHYFTDA